MTRRSRKSVVVQSDDAPEAEPLAAWVQLESALQAKWAELCPESGPLEADTREEARSCEVRARMFVRWLPGFSSGAPPVRFVIEGRKAGPRGGLSWSRSEHEPQLVVCCSPPRAANGGYGFKGHFDKDVAVRFLRRKKLGTFDLQKAIKVALEVSTHYSKAMDEILAFEKRDADREAAKKSELAGVSYYAAGLNASRLDNGLYLVSFSRPSGVSKDMTLDTLKKITQVILDGEAEADEVAAKAARERAS